MGDFQCLIKILKICTEYIERKRQNFYNINISTKCSNIAILHLILFVDLSEVIYAGFCLIRRIMYPTHLFQAILNIEIDIEWNETKYMKVSKLTRRWNNLYNCMEIEKKSEVKEKDLHVYVLDIYIPVSTLNINSCT